MCWATPSSFDNSPIVFNAPGSLSPPATRGSVLGDPVAHDLAGAESHHAPRSNRYLDPSLGIAADALALVTQNERPEARDLHVLADRERMAHVVKHAFDHARRFRPRQAKPAMNDVGEVRPSQRSIGVRVVDTRDPEIGHDILPPSNGVACRFDYTFVTEIRLVGNSTIAGYSNFFNT